MDYYSTKRQEEFYGSGAYNRYFMRYGRGQDFVAGAGSGSGHVDALFINYQKAPIENIDTVIDIDRNGYLDGATGPRDVTTLYFSNMTYVDFTGNATDDTIGITVESMSAGNFVLMNGGAGYDHVNLSLGDGDDQFTALRAGGAKTTIGSFEHIEAYSIDFGGGKDTAQGGVNADIFSGGDGDDQLQGGGGDDRLNGGAGTDQLTGGAGADIFSWNTVGDSQPATKDVVLDFSHAEGDKLDLASVDAGRVHGVQHFTFIDQAAFTGEGGTDYELRQQVNADGTVTLLGDTNHDGKANFAIVIHTDAPLVAADLIL